ncbi:MAG: hypothetical protein IPG06_09425 [Haliea sp.]|nr:hypothetical protein [Haliea sp.]
MGCRAAIFHLEHHSPAKQVSSTFGGMNDTNRFDPNQIKIDSSESPMRMTGISFPEQDDNRSTKGLSDVKNLQLTYKDQVVTFQFSVLDFIDVEKNQFRYKLENFDTQWIESGTRNTATYAEPPRRQLYVLRVQGATLQVYGIVKELNLAFKCFLPVALFGGLT